MKRENGNTHPATKHFCCPKRICEFSRALSAMLLSRRIVPIVNIDDVCMQVLFDTSY